MRHRKQAGLTMISWMVVFALVSVQGVMALRIFPIYLNYNSVKNVMNELQGHPRVKGITRKKLDQLIRKGLKINNLYDLSKNKDAFSYKKIKGGYNVVVNYEDRGPILGNLEFAAKFSYEVDVITK
ncbi:hypothetical protein MNBD_GAMMA07-2014 [hydrothermal vent metagenome]|uniref:DUF4845 domain-containing protein n=1 Tax=hydrothermal vent metagenome TaxID=652676 RepID=A0A3B0WLK8_9ZZZZ